MRQNFRYEKFSDWAANSLKKQNKRPGSSFKSSFGNRERAHSDFIERAKAWIRNKISCFNAARHGRDITNDKSKTLQHWLNFFVIGLHSKN